ncbi:MAG: DUF6020 family protein [Akkermansia sp.]|nr:DUF6020 family protein [Akkermansia sp.]
MYSIIYLMALYCLFYHAIKEAYTLFGTSFQNKSQRDANCKGGKLLQKYLSLLQTHPFRVSFFTLLAIYAPLAIISYPGLFKWDLDQQILQAFPELQAGLSSYTVGHQIDSDVYLCNHHPIAHTMLVHCCIRIGLCLLHNGNIGVYLFTLLQFASILCAIAYAMQVAVNKACVPSRVCACLLAFMALFPRVQSFVFLITKDVPYAAALLTFIAAGYTLAVRPGNWKHEKKALCLFIISAVATISFRNEGIYVITPFLLLCACFLKNIRKSACAALIVIFFSTFIKNASLEYYHVNPGSIRETLCLPLQQTARYVVTYPAEVTEEEKRAINQVIPYEEIAHKYNIDSADPIKDSWREHQVSAQDTKDYLRAWFHMFAKHPLCYIEATFINHYLTFYPGRKITTCPDAYESVHCMDLISQKTRMAGFEFHHPPVLLKQLQRYIMIREKVYGCISILASAAIYTWIAIFLIAYFIWKRNPTALAFLTLPGCVTVICILGPLNADYGRYIFPLILTEPFLVLYLKQIPNTPKTK